MVQLNNTFKQLAVHDGQPARATKPQQARPRTKVPAATANANAFASLPSSTAALLSLLAGLTSSSRRSPAFTPTLQHVKSLLYNKDYLAAFGTDSEQGERWREVYFARWTPARAVLYERAFRELGIARILGWGDEHEGRDGGREVSEARRERGRARAKREDDDGTREGESVEHRVIMVGAGAGAEIVALGCVLDAATSRRGPRGSDERRGQLRPRVRVQAIDQGNWANLVRRMDDSMKTEWSALRTGEDTVGGGLEIDFVRGDVLSTFAAPPSTTTTTTATSSDGAPPLTPSLDTPNFDFDLTCRSLKLVTICFTITELLLQSRVSTLRFLSTLTSSAPRGLHLLIVEGASLAVIPIGTSGRTYPLGQLLDHALLGGGGERDGQWDVVESHEGKWYRMPDGAEAVYNDDVDEGAKKGTRVKLENSRVVLRLYRKR
ncbi:hypothetical protein JCM10212_001846 [Sporobolomyces blumeae]